MGFEGKINKVRLRVAIASGANPELVREAARRGGLVAGKRRREKVRARGVRNAERSMVFSDELKEAMERGARRAAYERGDHLLPDL